jgi:hypothetical protein
VWKDFQLAYTLEGHEQSVWAVLALEGDEDLVLTGEHESSFGGSAHAHVFPPQARPIISSSSGRGERRFVLSRAILKPFARWQNSMLE